MSENKYFNLDELHALSCNFVVDNYLKQNGFELAEGFPRKQYPNIVCRKNGQLYGIVVIPSIFPNYEILTNEFRIDVVKLCKSQNAIALFAPVGFKAKDEKLASKSLVSKDGDFRIFFPGFVVLNEKETQNLSLKDDEYFRP